jgi:hypothetical protein
MDNGMNTNLLFLQLQESGIFDVEGCDSNGEVWMSDGKRIQDRPDVAAVIAGYDAYAAAHGVTKISTDSNIIIGDWTDQILLSVQGVPNALVTIDTLCGVTTGTIQMQLDADGNGAQIFSCETSSSVIVFSCGDISCKVRAL